MHVDLTAALSRAQGQIVAHALYRQLAELGTKRLLIGLDANVLQGFEAKVDLDDPILVKAVQAALVVAQGALNGHAGVGEERLAVGSENLEEFERLAALGKMQADGTRRDHPA